MAKRKQKRSKGGGGGLMSMRTGMQRMVGQGPPKKRSTAWNVVSWILVAGIAAAAIFVLARRFL